ncbi:MAG: peptidyl-prolyl cis-trans isomerase [Hyphomicrobiaceae bacterium]
MLRTVLREPLVHFLALALVIFVAYGALNNSDTAQPGRIIVTQARIEQIASLFARTWQRPPTPAELKGLIDDYVKEEVYYREGLALGLDKDDTLIRRRLRQKMEFLNDAETEALKPTDAELEQYLKANLAKFAIEPAIAFRQIYLNRERRGDKADEEAKFILETLRSNPALDPESLGDTTLLPSELTLTSKAAISQTFGTQFAEAIVATAPGAWSGPIQSSFGLHLVHVSEIKPGRTPMLQDVRDAVAREWANDKRKALADARFSELLKRYEVTIESGAENAAQAAAAR